MAGPKVLVLGGTGPAGICLIRELLHRNHAVVVYARTPSKIPDDLARSPLLEVIEGTLADIEKLSPAVSSSHTIISLLGPGVTRTFNTATYTDFYNSLFALMRTHNTRRIFAMGTLCIPQPEDTFSLKRFIFVLLVRLLAQSAYQYVLEVARVFTENAEGIDWTIYRIAAILGSADEEAWRKDREDGEAFEGATGHSGWTLSQKRAALARWLVDAVEDGKAQWVRKMPAVSRMAGSKSKAS